MEKNSLNQNEYNSKNYNFLEFEKKWQEIWENKQLFKVDPNSNLPKYYVLEMFPYPSGKIHMGHVRNYAIGDVIARYKKSKGFNVLHPMGWDSFGLPAENAAKDQNLSPQNWTISNIKSMKTDLNKIGLSINWDREIITSDPVYYKHEQKMFIDLYNHGLAYKKETFINWDPVEETVLANEQVIEGKGWRSGAKVEQKKLSQWFLKITDFAEDLLKDLENLDKWPHQVKLMQKNWIGKSCGAIINFSLSTPVNNINIVEIYTTRPDTIYGASFIAISKNHALALEVAKNQPEINNFIQELNNEVNIQNTNIEKKGMYIGINVKHPFIENKELPIYISNFVLDDYGSGAIFGVPAHDNRDFDFAKKYNLPIITVVSSPEDPDFNVTNEPFTGNGIIKNSSILNGLNTSVAKNKIIQIIEQNNLGKATTKYQLRDWGVSRQRFWGCPIPIIYCPNCGIVPEDIKNLPVTLPQDIDFSNTKGNPLDTHPTWKHTKCPKCQTSATRETDTFDTFVESSWYFLKFVTQDKNTPFTKEDITKWLPVDDYIGGIEHAILHLLYARFFVKALNKIGYFKNLIEPFTSLTTQGMICHKTYKTLSGNWVFPEEVFKQKDGSFIHKNTKETVIEGTSEKMSKSKKNVVSPDYICTTYGADTARLFILSDAPPTKDLEWNEEGIEGAWRFINKLWKFALEVKNIPYTDTFNLKTLSNKELDLLKFTNKSIKDTENNIKTFMLNKAIANIRELFNLINNTFKENTNSKVVKYSFCILLQLISPFTPHISEEIWHTFGFNNFIILNPWPTYNPALLITDKVTIAVQFAGKTKGTINVSPNITQSELVDYLKKDPKFLKFFDNKSIKKVIYVQTKIINILLY